MMNVRRAIDPSRRRSAVILAVENLVMTGMANFNTAKLALEITPPFAVDYGDRDTDRSRLRIYDGT